MRSPYLPKDDERAAPRCPVTWATRHTRIWTTTYRGRPPLGFFFAGRSFLGAMCPPIELVADSTLLSPPPLELRFDAIPEERSTAATSCWS